MSHTNDYLFIGWGMALGFALGATFPGCTPEAQQIAGPVVAASPLVCAAFPAGSAERDVCEASAELAQALNRLAAERARARAASSAPAPEGSSATH